MRARVLTAVWAAAVLMGGLIGALFPSAPASAAVLSAMRVIPSTPAVSATGVSYQINLQGPSAATVRCISVTFGTSPTPAAGPMPASMALTSPTLAGSTSIGNGWGTANVTGNRATWSKVAGDTLVDGMINVTGITNPNASGSYYLVVESHSDAGCTTTVDVGLVGFAITTGASVSATIDPVIAFAVGGHSGACNGIMPSASSSSAALAMSLGSVNRNVNAFVAQDLTISTNAASGYTIYVSQAQPMMDDQGRTLAGLAAANTAPVAFPAPGTEAFGYTTSDANLGTGNATRFAGGAFAGLTSSPAEIAYRASGPNTSDVTCVGYMVGVSPDTVSGNYATTVVYSAVPVY